MTVGVHMAYGLGLHTPISILVIEMLKTLIF